MKNKSKLEGNYWNLGFCSHKHRTKKARIRCVIRMMKKKGTRPKTI